MKKMVILLLSMLSVAVSATANTVAWGLQDNNKLADITSGTIYLVYGTAPSASTWNKESFSSSDISGKTVSSGSLDDGFFSEAGVTVVPSTIGETAAANRSFYAIAFSDDGKKVAVSTAKSARIATGTMASGFKWESGNFTTYTATPEPCAVALLLLGAAAVGLKRRA